MQNDKGLNEDIMISREQRAAFLDRVEVLNKVKALMLIPDLLMVTTQQVAEFFEVDADTVQKCYQRNRAELDGSGVVLYTPSQVDELIGNGVQLIAMKGKRLYCVGKDTYFEIANKETVAEYHLDTIETQYGVRHNRGTVTRKMTDAAASA